MITMIWLVAVEALNGDAGGAVDGNRRNRHRRRHPSEVKMAVLGPLREANARGGWDQDNQKKGSGGPGQQTFKSQNPITQSIYNPPLLVSAFRASWFFWFPQMKSSKISEKFLKNFDKFL